MPVLSKEIKIAEVVCVLPPYGGGIGTVADSYAEQLTERGHHVTVFTAQREIHGETPRKYAIERLWPILRYGNSAILPQLIWKLWPYDLIHLHTPYFGSTLPAVLCKIFRGKKQKLVLSYHMDITADGLLGFVYRLYKAIALKLALHFADRIIVASEDYIENSDIQEYYLKHINKFVEIPFGVTEEFKPTDKSKALLEQYGFSELDKIVGFVGGLDNAHYFKGVNYLIKAFDYIQDPNIKCLIVGQGNLRAQYQTQVKSLGLADRVIFANPVRTEQLPEYYNLFDIFVLPSISKAEAFGIVLLEAMSCGKPLIASDLKGVRKVVDSGTNGLIAEPKNSHDIALKIISYFEHPAMLTSFRKNAIDNVAKKYRWPIIANKLLETYAELFQ